MNGKAPKIPATGSQVLFTQKRRPNCRTDSRESQVRTMAIPATSSGTSSATAPVPSRKPPRSRARRPDATGVIILSVRTASRRGYLTLLSAVATMVATFAGRGAYPRSPQSFCPSDSAHFMKSSIIFDFALSFGFWYSRIQVNDAIG